MKLRFNKIVASLVLAGAVAFTACNKENINAVPATAPNSATGTQTINEIINGDANLTFLKAAVARAGTNISSLISDASAEFTLFAPTNTAFTVSGVTSIAMINAMPAAQVEGLLRYHLAGGRVTSAMFPTTFPNLQLPTQIVLAPPSASVPPGLRMSNFPSKRGSNLWVNNVPITEADIHARNGVIHKTAFLMQPPTAMLWNRITADPNLTYMHAAILRADSGATAATSLAAALQNPGANLTVFAPNDNVFRATLTEQIRLALIAQSVPPATALAQATALASTPAVFSNPALYSVLTATVVKGIAVYHLFGNRAFSVNLPATSTGGFPTLLNSAVPIHPGLTLQATFGPTGVTAATVKGVANPAPANIAINPTPGTGTSDQLYVNGILHFIDQVLLPQ